MAFELKEGINTLCAVVPLAWEHDGTSMYLLAWFSWITHKKGDNLFFCFVLSFHDEATVRFHCTMQTSQSVQGCWMLLLNGEVAFFCPLVASLQVTHFPTAVKFAVTNHAFHIICHTSVCTKQQNQLMFFFYTCLLKENWQQGANMCDSWP